MADSEDDVPPERDIKVFVSLKGWVIFWSQRQLYNGAKVFSSYSACCTEKKKTSMYTVARKS